MHLVKSIKLIARINSFEIGSLLCFVFALLSSLTLAADLESIANDINADRVPNIEIATGVDKISIGSMVSYFEDKNNSFTFSTINTPDQLAQFYRSELESQNFGYTDSTIWVVFDVEHFRASEPLTFYLNVGYPITGRVKLQLHKDGKLVDEQEEGCFLSYTNRKIKTPEIIFPISMEEVGTYRVILKINSEHSLALPLKVLSDTGMYDQISTNRKIVAIYFGIVTGIFFYNLFLIFALKSKAYLFYILYLASLASFQSTTMGVGFEYLWADHPWLNYYLANATSDLAVLTSLVFSRAFLRIKDFSKRLDNCFKWVITSIALTMPLIFVMSIEAFSNLVICFTLISFVLMISASIIALKNGMTAARYYLIAWAVMIFFAMLYIGYITDLLPESFIFFYSLQIGSSIEAVLLSIALADRINSLNRENQGLQKSNLQTLEASNKVKENFLATISHELRTPINGVQGALELMRLDRPTPQVESHINMAKESSKHMLSLIENILQFSEAQSGSLQVREEDFNLEATLKEIFEDFAQSCGNSFIDFDLKIAAEIGGTWKGDKHLLSKLVSLLMENAIKFTKTGSITLNASVKQHELIHAHRYEIIIEIRDTGIGIAKDHLDSIFSAFQQVDASFSRRYSGLGIGLAVVKQICQLLSGEVNVKSKENEGSRFTITLPLTYMKARSITPLHEKETQSEVISIKAPCILIVEDNKVNQTVMKGLLKKLGCETITAENGVEGVKAAENERIDLILMDCQMPVMDGFTATQTIRNLAPPKSEVPIIAVTANTTSKDREKCIDCGMDDYLEKPITLKSLKTALSRYLKSIKAA